MLSISVRVQKLVLKKEENEGMPYSSFTVKRKKQRKNICEATESNIEEKKTICRCN